MSLSNIYTAGLHNVGSYQVAGRPYLSGSTGINDSTSERFIFPQVSKSILVKNTHGSTAIRIGFAPKLDGEHGFTHGANDNNNYFVLNPGKEISFNVKCKEIFIWVESGTGITAQVYAELTEISDQRMFTLDGVVGVAS
tara:strand:+ start:3248 stop:3664 length:417 start_codon:yes stop_codon:yes gene_type:complete